jgi:hypothetical protein
MPSRQIAVQIKGTAGNDEDVRFSDFITQLTAVRKALTETERVVSKNPRSSSVDYRIIDLRHFSPAEVIIEAIPILGVDSNEYNGHMPEMVTDTFFRGLRDVTLGQAPPEFDYHALQAFKELAGLVAKGKEVSEVLITYEGEILRVEPALLNKVDHILGPDIFEIGSVTGMLERLNIHSGQNTFTVYPTSNRPQLRCLFGKELRTQVVMAVGKYVSVYGRLKYKSRDAYPYEMMARRIEAYPDQSELPSLSALWGIAPNLTGGKSSDDFIRDIRNEWQ